MDRLLGYTVGDKSGTYGWKKYSSYGGNRAPLDRNAFGEICRSHHDKSLVIWKTKAGAEQNVRDERYTEVVSVFMNDNEIRQAIDRLFWEDRTTICKAWLAVFGESVVAR